MKIKSLFASLIMIFSISFVSCSKNGGDANVDSQGLEYFLSDDEQSYSVSARDKDITKAIIPSKFNEKYVTRINDYAFSGCTSLTTIVIPDSIASIGFKAFSGCRSLTSIALPDSVTSIDGFAFYDCRSLTTIVIPNSVTSIGDGVFSDCRSLIYNSYDDAYYLGNDSNPYLYLAESISYDITSCKINNNTRFIGYGAFSGCTSLTSIVMPEDVTLIGDYAFSDCTSLSSITLPDGLTSIGDYVFDYCIRLTSVVIPDSITSIGNSAFSNCSSLTSITLPDNVTSIGNSAFRHCSSLTSITLPNSISSIGSGAFSSCTSLIYNPYDNAYYLGNNSNPYLYLATAISKDITYCRIYDNTRFIGDSAFLNCTSLTSITLPNSVTSIDSRTFNNCTSLTSIIIPDSVTYIGYEAFYGCSALKVVYYTGTPESWDDINIDTDRNEDFTNATRYYYSETEPTDTTYKYWHYVNDEPTPW